MKVNIKKLDEKAIIPKYAEPGDAGMDLTAISKEWDEENKVWSYGTGLAMEIPEGYVGLIFPRSSVFKQDLSLSNNVGVIDSGYRGEISFKFSEITGNGFVDKHYNVGDRIGQIIILPYPQIKFMEVEHLTKTSRGSGGYGSTGN